MLEAGSIYREMARADQKAARHGDPQVWRAFLDEIKHDDSGDQIPNIVEYIESSVGTGEDVSLYPIQRFILKVITGVPLDDENRDIEVWDEFRENLLSVHTEREFLWFLHQEKKCNISPEDYENRLENNKRFTDIVFRLGRRGTKTSCAQWMAKYEVYKLTRLLNPQRYYKKLADTLIGIMLVSVNESKAQKLLTPALNAIKQSPSLSRYIVNPRTTTKLELLVGDSSDPRERRSRIEINTAPCSARSMRGDSNIMILLEEFGHFFYELSGSDKSDKQVYDALEPSKNDFVNPKTGEPDGLMLIISTPGPTNSYMHEVERLIWSRDTPNGLVLHIPSYWVSPLLTPTVLKSAYNRDPDMFRQEYGAEYVAGVSTALSFETIESCWSCNHDDPGDYGALQTGEVTGFGLDLGLSHDGSGLSVVAVHPAVMVPRLVWHEYHNVAMEEYRSAGITELSIVSLAQRVDILWNQFGCASGYADFWNLPGFVALLKSQAKNKLQQINVTPQENDRVARAFLEHLNQARLILYRNEPKWDFGNSDESKWDLSREFLNLVKIRKSGDPPKIKLCAVDKEGAHDDQYSSVSRALVSVLRYCTDNLAGSGATSERHHQRYRQHREALESRRLRRQAQESNNRTGNKRSF